MHFTGSSLNTVRNREQVEDRYMPCIQNKRKKKKKKNDMIIINSGTSKGGLSTIEPSSQ